MTYCPSVGPRVQGGWWGRGWTFGGRPTQSCGMRRRPSRRNRGIALLATVTLAAVAGVAAIVIITLTLDATRNESSAAERSDARAEAYAAKVRLEEALAEAPLFFYSEVHELERARICTEGDGRVVEPGGEWPAECGSSWGYQQASVPGDVRVELRPGNLDDANLNVKILSSAGKSEYGLELEYRPDSLARYSIYSEAGLNLEDLPAGTNELSGEIYSGGAMTLPNGAVSVSDGLFVAEGGYTGHPDGSSVAGEGARFYAGEPDTSGEIMIQDSQNLYATPPGSMAGAQAMFAGAIDIACPGTAATLKNGRATHLCLRAGEEIVAAAGGSVSVPEDVVAYLLIFSVEGAETVDVYTSAKTSSAPDSCGGTCNLAGSSAGSIAAGNHPGDTGYWTKLATAVLPTNGIVALDRDTHVGLCGENFDETGEACINWDGSGGMRVNRNVTVLAGSLVNPSDIYLSGPIDVAADRSFGAVAAGRVYIPYWARGVGADYTVVGSYSGLGLGDSGAGVSTYPATVPAGASRFGRLTIDGGVSGASIEAGFQLFDAVSIQGRDRHWKTPPILYPAMDGNWKVADMRYLPSIEVCGEIRCTNW